MKSLVEEASSITKAIEKAWTRAGMPLEFSVKIFETPEAGFLGLTTKKSAKVGIFFEESAIEKPVQRSTRPTNSNNRRPERSRSNDRAPRSNDRARRPERQSDNRGQGARPQRDDDRNRDDRSPRRHESDRPSARPQRSTGRPSRDDNRSSDDRPPRRRENDRPSARPQRSIDRPSRDGDRNRDDRPPQRANTRPEQSTVKPVAPKVDTPSPLAASTSTVKKPLKISGRRFSGHKKTDDK